MATLQGMSGLDILPMLNELRRHLPLWIGKIYQYDPKTFGFRLNGEKGARYFFILESGRRAHLVDKLPPAPPSPAGFSMLLRKYLSGGRILAIRQYGLQRIFEFEIGKRDTTFHLIFELFDEGNIVLCADDYRIFKPLWHHRFKDREIVPGAEYSISGNTVTKLTFEQLSDILQESDRDVVRTIAVKLLLGGRYAEEVCLNAGIDKDAPAGSVDAEKLYSAYCNLIDRLENRLEPVITPSGCWPIVPAGEEIKARFESYNAALAEFYPESRIEIREKEKRPKLSRSELIRRRQQEAIRGFEKEIERIERCIETIYANYPLVQEVISTLDAASRSHSWQEIEDILRSSGNETARSVVRVHPAESAVDLALDEQVRIHVHETVEVNIGRYYDRLKKFKKKKAGAIAAMQQPVREKVPAKKIAVFRKPRWYHRFRWMFTSDGVLVIGGRDASQNEELVKRYMEGGDRFVHAEVHGASVVLVKGETEMMDEVAQFAASYSNAWKAGHFSADVYAVGPDQVSKTPESGEYVARGSFIVRGERTYFRNTPLGIAIGVQTEPATGVIGGAVAPVSKRCVHHVVLTPGKYEPNDIARKIIRVFREKFPEREWNGLKKVVNTEAVAAFVPPGGSDISETV